MSLVEWVGLASVGVALVSGVLYILREFTSLLRFRRKVTWRTVRRSVLALIESIEAREYKPDIVVGISRDGAVVSGMIASNLRLRPVANMDRIVEIQNGVGNIEILDCVAGELTNKKVLLVDSVCVTGWTLQELSKYLSTKRGAKVKTAVLFETTSPKLIEPDFYGMILKEEPVLPWQMTDIAKYRVRSHYRLYEDR